MMTQHSKSSRWFTLFVLAWSVFSALLVALAFHDLRQQFSVTRHYFILIPSTPQLRSTEEDLRAREALRELERRGALPDIVEKLRKDPKALGALYAEYQVLPPGFYWLFLVGATIFWGMPIGVAALFRLVAARQSATEPAV